MSADVIDALWTPILKYPKDKDTGDFDYNRPPTLRIKIPFWEGVFKSEIYDMEKTMLFPNADNESLTPSDFIVRTSNLAAVITCGGIWFANGKFGVTWKLLQAMVKPKQSLKGKCHIDLDVDEKSKLSKQVVDEVDDDIRKILDDMLDTMYDAPGIGLAAIQIGIPLRMLVIDISSVGDQENNEKDPQFFINPEIVGPSDNLSIGQTFK